MNSFYALEQLAHERIQQRLVEADHERLLSEARRGQAVPKRGSSGAQVTRLWRMRFWRVQPIARSAPEEPCYG
jgi:hypothetical protein